MPPTLPPVWRRRLARALPWALLAGALALALATTAAELDRRAERRHLVDRVASVDLPPRVVRPLVARAARADDPVELRLEIARRLVHQVLQPEVDGEGGDPEEAPEEPSRRETVDREDLEGAEIESADVTESAEAGPTTPPLVLAGAFAAEALERRPAAWRAPHLLASAVYLQRARAQDIRLVTEASDWNRPLARARELAPAAPEPVRFQATAYLELWPTLPPERRDEARGLLRRAMEDGPTFSRLIPVWLDIAEAADASLEETLAVVPDDDRAWSLLTHRYLEDEDWRAAMETRRRWHEAKLAGLESDLDDAADLVRQGREFDARKAYLNALAGTPTDARFATLAGRALAEAPPGPAQPSQAVGLYHWLDWALDLDRVGANPLGAEVGRLADSVAGLPDADAAHAALAAGDLADAEGVERRVAGPGGPPPTGPGWARYWTAKARRLAERGDDEGCALAVAALARSPGGDRPSSRQARAACGADRPGTAGDPFAAEDGWRQTDQPRGRTEKVAGAREAPWRREIHLSRAAGGLRLAAAPGTAPSAPLLEIRLDGRTVALERVRDDRPVDVETTLAPGLHLVEVSPLGGAYRPGELLPLSFRARPLEAPRAGGGAADGD